MRLKVEFRSISDFIPSLAKELNIGFKDELAEYSLFLPQDKGTGYIKGVEFPNGLALYNFSCTFRENTELCVKHLILKPIKIIHCLTGNLQSWINDKKKNHEIKPHQYTIVSPRIDEYHTVLFKKDVEYQISYLELDRTAYMKSLPFRINDTNPLFYNMFHNSHVLDGHLLPASFSMTTSDVIKQLRNCSLKGLPRINFLGAKALEMLSNTLQTYKEVVIHDRRQGLTEDEYNSISTVADEINNNLEEKKNNSELAKLAGMNVHKLQKCFQTVYGRTINEYIRDVRLSRALELLQTKEKNINEVVYAVGLSSHSYFSRIFKEKYGISPRDLSTEDD
ncbi:helix-turn-helix transcriptional regulator [Zunongwangia sp. F363]|uniref:Helix-turn-helix transcriptional regulator n=1 Tax=Autumnicola tepida TaxID=3075595 RepID=A0ABU3CBW5_9FLAO|nr:helix-turn-helix transcriptional regulator [Zunongwangia sp. F363]MDT0643824.1 helix-turn-helix transcriptional regulator [Zunongwangia sp. F363]